jgi:hypothetical protein
MAHRSAARATAAIILILIGLFIGLIWQAGAVEAFPRGLRAFFADEVVLARGGEVDLIIAAEADNVDSTVRFKSGATPTVRFTLGTDGDDSHTFKIDTGDGFSGAPVIAFPTAGNMGVGTSAPDARLDFGGSSVVYDGMVTINTDAMTSGITQPGLIIQGDSGYESIWIESHGGYTASIQGARGRGTVASPQTTQAGDILFQVTGRGYDNAGTPAMTGERVLIRMTAIDNFTTTEQGTRIDWRTTPSGSTTHQERMRLSGIGNLGIGTSLTQAILHTNAASAPRFDRDYPTDGNTTQEVLALVRSYDGGAGADGIGVDLNFYAETETEGTAEGIGT